MIDPHFSDSVIVPYGDPYLIDVVVVPVGVELPPNTDTTLYVRDITSARRQVPASANHPFRGSRVYNFTPGNLHVPYGLHKPQFYLYRN